MVQLWVLVLNSRTFEGQRLVHLHYASYLSASDLFQLLCRTISKLPIAVSSIVLCYCTHYSLGAPYQLAQDCSLYNAPRSIQKTCA